MNTKIVQPKRALFLVITDHLGGAERVAYGLASELARRDWTVEVMIGSSAVPNSFSQRTLSRSVRVSYGLAPNRFLAFPLLPFRLIFRRYDLVFTTQIYTNALVSVLRKLRLIRVAKVIFRESTSLFDRSKGLRRHLFGWLYHAYGAEDLIIAQTRYMAEHVRPWLPKRSAGRLHVLPNPIDFGAIQRDAAGPVEPQVRERLRGRTNILFCGRLIPVKRPEQALEAFRLATKNIPESQLVYVGEGPLEEDLRRRAEQAGLATQVLFLGYLSRPYSVMANCQYGLITSEKEGFPNVALEMMACGFRRIIVTPCAGDLDRLDGVEVTTSFDAIEMGDRLRRAIQSGEDRGEIYRACARSRSIGAYLDNVLRLAEAKPDLPGCIG